MKDTLQGIGMLLLALLLVLLFAAGVCWDAYRSYIGVQRDRAIVMEHHNGETQ
jgi:hypothetical protein